MEERDQEFGLEGTHELASEVSERVRSVISAAEAAGNAVRHEAEQAGAVRRRIAEEEATRIVEDAKREADAYLEERRRRIAELSDTVVERAEKIVARLDRAEEVRKQLQGLADALGESAETLAVDLRDHVPPTVPSASAGTAAPEAPAAVEALEPEAAGAAVAEPEPEAEAAEPEPPGSPAAAGAEEPVAESAVEEDLSAEAPEVVPLTGTATVEPVEQPTGEDRREPDDQLSARLVALQMAVAGGNRGDVSEHLRQTFGIDDPSAILDDVFGPGSDSDKRVAWPQSGGSAA